MDPNRNTSPSTQPTDSNVASWFQSVDAPVTNQPAPQPGKKHTRIIIVASAIILILVIGTILFVSFNHSKACLTTKDYTALTGSTVDSSSISPSTNFYTTVVNFIADKTTYDDTDKQGDTIVKNVAQFYNDHSSSSIIITIKGTYTALNALDITQERMDTIKDSLVSQGVPASAITTSIPGYIIPEEDASGDPSSVLISITSAETCN